MNKFGKIIAVVATIIVVLVVVLVVLAKVVITPERVKETVLPIAEESLKRKIELGDISVSIFSGIELQGLKVYEADGKELFVSTELVRLKYQLLPLLAMKVVVDEVTLEKPRIRVVRLADGSFSFDDIVGTKEQSAGGTSNGESSGSSPISLLVSEVKVSDGALAFIDYQIDSKTPFTTEISSLQVAAKGITLTGSIPVSLSCKLNNSTFAADGSVSLDGSSVELKVKLDDVDVLRFSPYFKDAVPGKLSGLALGLESTVGGDLKNISAAGSLRGSGLNLALDALPDAPLQNARFTVDYDLSVNLDAGVLDLRSARVDFNSLVAEASGKVSSIFASPTLDLQAKVPGLDLRKAISSVPPALVESVKDMDPSGVMKLSAHVAGKADDEPAKLVRKASVTLEDVQASAGGQRPSLAGKLNLSDGKLVSEALEMRMDNNRARIDLNASNLFGQTIIVKADVASDEFQLDPLLGAGGAAGAAADKKGAPKNAAADLGPFDIPVKASGSIKIGKTLYKGLAIDNFIARYALQDNILTISQMDGNIAGGSFANTARVDLGTKGLAYSADLGVKTIQADPLLTAFIPKAAGALLGAMNLDLSIKGSGTQWETMSKKLSGQGDMLVADGRVVSPGLVKGFASFLQLSNVDEILFENFQGKIKIADGKLQIDSSILSNEIKLFPKGTIGLDGSLNLSLDTRLSPQVAGRLDSGGKVSKYLTDDDGWSQVPLLVSGNYASPSFGLDPKGVQKQATKALGKELGRQIDKLFGAPKTQEEGQTQPEGQQQPAETPAKKLLQDSLKGLFGN